MNNPLEKLLDVNLSKVIPGMEMMGEKRKLIDAVEELQNEYKEYVKDKPETKRSNLDITRGWTKKYLLRKQIENRTKPMLKHVKSILRNVGNEIHDIEFDLDKELDDIVIELSDVRQCNYKAKEEVGKVINQIESLEEEL